MSLPPAVAPRALAPLALALRSGQLDLGDYIEETLRRVEGTEPAIQALLPEPGRADRLRSEAAVLASRYPDPARRPPLYGVLVGIKDLYSVKGFDTRAGSRLPPELFALPEGPVVAALRRAGALILGKTVTTEFAYFAPGPTANPWNLDHTPGGSSSGSAAAVAAGFCSLATGTQTIGSISRPAAFCGVAGWKPSYERLSREGIVPFSPSVDHAGLFAPDAAGLALAGQALDSRWDAARHAEALSAYATKRPALLIPAGPYLAQAEPKALAAFEATIAKLGAAGFIVDRVPMYGDIEDINARHRLICAADLARVHAAWFPEYERLYAPQTAELIRTGRAVAPERLSQALEGRSELKDRLESALRAHAPAFWLSPAAPGPAPRGLSATGSPLMNLPWTHAGLPTLALPAGLSQDGMPLGLQLAAPFGWDEELLALGEILQKLV